MRIRAIKECPQGQMPGTVWEAPDAAAYVLIAVGAAEEVATAEAVEPAAPATPRRRTYRRRDLQAEA